MKISNINYVNLTPHNISLVLDDGIHEIPSEGIARAEEEKTLIKTLPGGIPIYKIRYGNVSGVPEPAENTYYVVSKIVADALIGRDDILIVTQTIRNEKGQIIGCMGFASL